MRNKEKGFDAFAANIAGVAGTLAIMSVYGTVYANSDYEKNVTPQIHRAKEDVDFPSDEQVFAANKIMEDFNSRTYGVRRMPSEFSAIVTPEDLAAESLLVEVKVKQEKVNDLLKERGVWWRKNVDEAVATVSGMTAVVSGFATLLFAPLAVIDIVDHVRRRRVKA